MFFPIIFDGQGQGIGPQVGTMQLVLGESPQDLGHLLVADLQGPTRDELVEYFDKVVIATRREKRFLCLSIS